MTSSVPSSSFRSPKLNRPIRLAVLISGGGTTLVNFLKKIKAGELNAEVAVVIASREGIAGIDRAREAGVPCEVIARKKFDSVDTEKFSDAIFDRCRAANVDLVTLAGFLSLIHIPPDFERRVLNIHPALIPAFCGQGFHGHHVHEAALARGVKLSGCTVHFADNEYDHGPILVQRAVPVLAGDTPDTLAARVFEAVCEAYPEAIRLFAERRLAVTNGTLQIVDRQTTREAQ